MEHNTPTVKTVRVRLQNLDERQFAIFRMAFKMHTTTRYELAHEQDKQEPQLVLVDGDARGGTEQWQSAKQRFSNARVVYFATQPPAFTAPYLAKPIRFDTLFTNLRNLLQGNGVWMGGLGEQTMVPPEAQLVTDNGAWFDPRNTVKPASVTNAFVPMPDTAAPTAATANHPRQETVSIRRFHTEGTLLGLVLQLLAQNEDMAVTADGKPALVIFPTQQKVLLAVNAQTAQALCTQAAPSFKTKPVPANHLLHGKAKLKSQAFVWQLAIWTAQGRLIDPITPDTILKLKSWPNMTRMAFLPESIRLSAFLIKTPVSLSMLYKLLPLDMADILNFLAATYAAGYLHIEQPLEHKLQQHHAEAVLSRAIPDSQPNVEMSGEAPAKQPHGLLQRLMNRLRS